MLVSLLLCAVLSGAPATYESLSDTFDSAPATLEGGATLVEGPTGRAARLAGAACVRYPATAFPREAGRVELDLAPHDAIVPRDDGRHWMLLTDVGAAGAWRGATVIYWDRDTAELQFGVFDGGWRWLTAAGVDWPVGRWRHVAFTYGPGGRTLEVDGRVAARDDYGGGIAPGPMRLGYIDSFSVAAPVLVDNLRVTGTLADAVAAEPSSFCPAPDGVLDAFTIRWTLAAPATARVDVLDARGRVAAAVLPPRKEPAGRRSLASADLPAAARAALGQGGAFRLRLTAERPGEAPEVRTAPLFVDARLRWRPAPVRKAERFPLGAWYFWEEDASYINRHVDDPARAAAYFERTLADLQGLGADTIIANWTPRDHRRALLDAARRHGIRVIVHLDEVNGFLWNPASFESRDWVREFRQAVDGVRRHPATLGYYLVDEPSPTPENRARIALAKRVVEALDPGHPGFSCLLGDYAELFREVGYHVLLVDIYPVTGAPLTGAPLEGYVAAVDRAREVAGERPLWVIPQCFGFGKPTPRAIPAPNEVRLMVWEAIAHGAKGIVYFIYQSTTGVQGEWLQGIVDMDLRPMDHRYAEVRAVNAAVRRLAPTLLRLRWRPNDLARCDSPSIDVQAFRHADGGDYLCVVNRDTRAPALASLRLPPGVLARDAATGAPLGSDGVAQVDLGPGEGKLLRLAPHARR